MLSYLNNLTTDSCFGETTTLFQQYLDYGNSKACTLIASNVLAEKLKGTDITVNTVDPGFTHTHIHKKSLELWFNSLWTKMHEFISYLFTQVSLVGRTEKEVYFTNTFSYFVDGRRRSANNVTYSSVANIRKPYRWILRKLLTQQTSKRRLQQRNSKTYLVNDRKHYRP